MKTLIALPTKVAILGLTLSLLAGSAFAAGEGRNGPDLKGKAIPQGIDRGISYDEFRKTAETCFNNQLRPMALAFANYANTEYMGNGYARAVEVISKGGNLVSFKKGREAVIHCDQNSFSGDGSNSADLYENCKLNFFDFEAGIVDYNRSIRIRTPYEEPNVVQISAIDSTFTNGFIDGSISFDTTKMISFDLDALHGYDSMGQTSLKHVYVKNIQFPDLDARPVVNDKSHKPTAMSFNRAMFAQCMKTGLAIP